MSPHIPEERFFDLAFVETAQWDPHELRHLRDCAECMTVLSALRNVRALLESYSGAEVEVLANAKASTD